MVLSSKRFQILIIRYLSAEITLTPFVQSTLQYLKICQTHLEINRVHVGLYFNQVRSPSSIFQGPQVKCVSLQRC